MRVHLSTTQTQSQTLALLYSCTRVEEIIMHIVLLRNTLQAKTIFIFCFFHTSTLWEIKEKSLRIWQSFWYHGGAGPYYYSIYARWWELKNRLNVEVESYLNSVWWFWCEKTPKIYQLLILYYIINLDITSSLRVC